MDKDKVEAIRLIGNFLMNYDADGYVDMYGFNGIIPGTTKPSQFFALNGKMFSIVENIDFSELCITSEAKIKKTTSSETSASTTKAEGQKCSVCWKINKNGCERHPV